MELHVSSVLGLEQFETETGQVGVKRVERTAELGCDVEAVATLDMNRT